MLSQPGPEESIRAIQKKQGGKKSDPGGEEANAQDEQEFSPG